jgi:sugar lactone lactonase YvrE
VYVADEENRTIRRVTSLGGVSTVAGLATLGSVDGIGGATRFNGPRGVALDAAGNVYVADYYNHTIRKISAGSVTTTLAGLAGNPGSADGTGSAARFNFPSGVAVDGGANVYVADLQNHTIRKITPAGVVTTLAGLAESSGSTDGTGSAARFKNPSGVTTNAAGNVYVADTNNHTIRKITPAGVVTTLAGSAGSSGSADGTGGAARFAFPQGVATDGSNIYVADNNNSTIRKITSAGVVTTLAGLAGTIGSADGTGSAARFWQPHGVAVDSVGNVYVADGGGNYLIRKITPAGLVTTLAGLADYYGSADGAGSAARFNTPAGVAVDVNGTLYVADDQNSVVRKGAPPPFIESPPIAIGTMGIQFIYQIQAAGATSYGATNLPPGLNVDSVLGIIYGTPTTVGMFEVIISASAQWTTTAKLTIVIQSTPSSGPIIASGASVTGRTGGFFTFDVITTGSATANVNASGLPPGLSVNPMTGFISGVPSSDNSSLVTLSATDGVGTHISTLQLTFVSNPTIPIITSPESATLVPGQPFSYTITADASAAFGYIGTNDAENGALPSGLSFHSPATISGTCGIITPTPGTIKIRPPLVARVQLNANDVNLTGTRPLNFFLPAVVSRKTFGPVSFDIALPLTGSTGIECRSGGANNDYQIVFAFPTAMTFTGATVTPGSGGSASISGAPITITTVDGTQVAVNLTNVSNGQWLIITLAGVHDNINANNVDVAVQMGVLVGDTNGNGTINSSDVSFVKLQSGQPISASNFRADVNGNGVINGSDVSLVKLRTGSSLPPVPTAFGQSKIRH